MKKTLSLFLALTLISAGTYIYFEPQLMKGAYDEFTVTQVVTGEVSLSDCGNIDMDPQIGGIVGGVGTGTTTCNVATSNSTGYNLSLSASSTPPERTLRTSSYYFNDYDYQASDATSSPNFTWSIPGDSSEFGYTVEGSQTIIQAKFKDTGTICNAGTLQTAYRCWHNASSTNETIGYYNAPVATATTTTIGFRAEVSTTGVFVQQAGNYTATIGITAATN